MIPRTWMCVILLAQIPNSPETVAATMRGLLVRNLPTPLYQKQQNWGRQTKVFSRIKWHGLDARPELLTTDQNDGIWRKLTVTAVDAEKNLRLALRSLETPEEGRTTFQLDLSLPVFLDYEQQTWAKGIRLLSHNVRARARIAMNLNCEMTLRFDGAGKLIPDLVLRLRVVDARIGYDQFKVEHALGVGGEAAIVIGDILRAAIHEWKPSIERELLAKANAAMVKAGDSRDIRIGLQGLQRAKKK